MSFENENRPYEPNEKIHVNTALNCFVKELELIKAEHFVLPDSESTKFAAKRLHGFWHDYVPRVLDNCPPLKTEMDLLRKH